MLHCKFSNAPQNLLIQHKFCCVILIGRILTRNQITPTYVSWSSLGWAEQSQHILSPFSIPSFQSVKLVLQEFLYFHQNRLQEYIHGNLGNLSTSLKGHFTHEPRAVTMNLWEPKRKCPKVILTHLQNHVVWSRILKCSVWNPMWPGPQPNAISMNGHSCRSSHMIK